MRAVRNILEVRICEVSNCESSGKAVLEETTWGEGKKRKRNTKSKRKLSLATSENLKLLREEAERGFVEFRKHLEISENDSEQLAKELSILSKFSQIHGDSAWLDGISSEDEEQLFIKLVQFIDKGRKLY